MQITDRLVSRNFGGVRATTDGVVLHSTGSAGARSQYGWFNNPAAKSSCHTHHDSFGVVERYVPDHLIAWTTGAGNARLLGIETQGDGTTAWTPEQIESLAQDIARMWRKYKFPLRLMTSSKKSEKGIGYHRLGVPRSKWVPNTAPGWLVIGGEKWSSAVGKVCPGDKRIAQMPEILARVKQIVGDTAPAPAPAPAPALKPKPKPKPAPKPATVTVLTRGSTGAKVRALQKALNKHFPGYRNSVKVQRSKLLVVDGHYGAATAAWVAEFQRRAGLYVDGSCGPLTQAALKKYGIKL